MKASERFNALMAMYLAAGLHSSPFSDIKEDDYNSLSDEEKLEYERKIKARYKDILLKKGLKEYTFDGITVIALNEKNAKRKIKKLKKN